MNKARKASLLVALAGIAVGALAAWTLDRLPKRPRVIAPIHQALINGYDLAQALNPSD